MEKPSRKERVHALFRFGVAEDERIEAVHESAERYRSLVESSGFGIATIDFRGRFTFVNEALCRMTGYSKKELIGKHFRNYLHPEDKQRILTIFLNAWKSPFRKPSLEFRAVHKKGHAIHMYSTPTLYRRNGKILGFTAIIADITERKKAEQAGRESRQKFERLFINIPEAAVNWDRDFRVLDINPRFTELFGYTLDEIKGKKNTEIIVPEDKVEESDVWGKKAKEGYAEHETVRKRKDGSLVHVSISTSPVIIEGHLIGYMGLYKDITERKKAEEALRESEEKYRNLFQNARDVIVTVDCRGNLTSANNIVSEYGYKPDELVGKSLFSLFPGKYLKEFHDYFQKLAEGKPIAGEFRIESKQVQGYNVIEYKSSPTIQDGKVVGAQVIARDVTERKKMEETLRTSEEKFKGLFQNARDVIVTLGLKGNITSINKTVREYDFQEDELIGKNMLKFVPKKHWPRLLNDLAKAVRGNPVEGEIEIITPKGKKIAEYRSNPIFQDNKIVALQTILRDMTERRNMEDSLRESEEKYRMLVENTKDSIVIIDLKGNVLFGNKATEELTGYTSENGARMNVRQITPLKYWPKSLEMLLKARQGKRIPYFESMIKKKDGTLIPVESGGQAVLKNGKVTGVQIITRDITERKKMEETLRDSEEKYRNLFENARDVILTVNLFGNVTSISRAIEDYGWKKEEIIGKNMLQLMPKRSWPSLFLGMTQIKEGRLLQGEIELATPKGRVIAEYKSNPITKDGKVIGVQIIGRDITERKKMEEKLRQYSGHLEELVQKRTAELLESEKRYSVLVEEADDGVVILQSGKIAFVNKKGAEKIGYSKKELIGLPFEKILSDKYRAFTKKMYEQRLLGETAPSLYETELVSKTGEPVPVEVSGVIIEYNGQPATLAVFRGILERKRLEEERLKLGKLAAIGELATMVAHDLRNPLTSIRNACFFIKNACPSRVSAECRDSVEMVNIIDQETTFANNIINDLLDFAAERQLKKKKQSVNKIIDSSLVKSNLPKNVNTERNFDKKTIVNVDEMQLERVFMNLIKNAAQAMPNGGKLTITTTHTKDHVEAAFGDTGVGISEENIGKVFQPLFTTKAKGIGMGLPICKKIVEQHGGTINVTSNVGEGTTVMIRLPREEANIQ